MAGPEAGSDAKRGDGAFQWNVGGWFGGQVGATLWLIGLGVLLLVQGRLVGAGVLALGLAPNALGGLLWSRRARVSPYPAIQALVGASGLCALAAMLWLRAAPSFRNRAPTA